MWRVVRIDRVVNSFLTLATLTGFGISSSIVGAPRAVADPLAVAKQQQPQPKVRLADVCELKVERDHLVLTSKLPMLPVARGLHTLANNNIEGLPGTSTVRIESPASAAEPAVFYLINNNADSSSASLVQTQVSCSNGQISIHQHSQVDEGWQVITFTQGPDDGPYAGEPNGVVLTVTRSQDPGERTYCAAANWLALRQQFPREVDAYLRPLFRSLRQDGVFAVEPVVAYQVLGGAASRSAAAASVGERIRKLIPQLGADDFGIRRKAMAALQQEGIDGALFLRTFDRTGLSTEQANQIDAFLKGYTLIDDDEVEHRRDDKNFLLDCLYCNDPGIRHAALAKLAAVAHKAFAFPAGATADVCHDTIAHWRAELASAAVRP
jgi:hypothetical protein